MSLDKKVSAFRFLSIDANTFPTFAPLLPESSNTEVSPNNDKRCAKLVSQALRYNLNKNKHRCRTCKGTFSQLSNPSCPSK